MKQKMLYCVAALLFATSGVAQDLKIKVNEKGKVGFVDKSGNEVVKCMYESAMPFKGNVAVVTKGGKSGFIDKTGNVVLPLKYEKISSWGNGMYMIESGKQKGLADKEGNVVLDAKYSQISKPNCYGKALITLGGKSTSITASTSTVNGKTTSVNKNYMYNAKYGIIDAEGKVLVEAVYKGLYEFVPLIDNCSVPVDFSFHYIGDTLKTDCSYMAICKSVPSSSPGVIDVNGNVLLEWGTYSSVSKPSDNMIKYTVESKKEIKCGYYNIETKTGFEVAKFAKPLTVTGETHTDFHGKLAAVTGDTWRFVDKSGNVAREGYASVTYSDNLNLWVAKKSDGKCEVIDSNGETVEALSGYENIGLPTIKGDKEIFSVSKGGKYGCISRNGDVVVPFEYEMAHGVRYGLIFVKKAGKWGAITEDNRIRVPIEYNDIVFPVQFNSTHLFVKKSDGYFYHYNSETNKLSDKALQSVFSSFKNGLAFVRPKELKVDSSIVNRALMCEPNTPIATVIATKFNEKEFGYLLSTDDNYVMDLPLTRLYYKEIADEIEKREFKPFTDGEKKNLILRLTGGNRSYNLNTVIEETEWNY